MRAAWLWVACLCAACGSETSGPFGPSESGAGGSGGDAAGSGGAGQGAGPGSGGGMAGAGGSGGTPVVCPDMALTAGEHPRQIRFGGNDREYEIQVPAGYDNTTAVPLVFDLHGYTSDKDQQQLVSGWQAQAEQHGFVVVRPNGTGVLRSWNGGDFCCGTAQSQNLDDVGLMKAIAAEVQTVLCIDPRRIYATGLSNGGALSHRLACEAADVFAAVAPVSYPIDFNPFDKCVPSRPIAVMHAHGLSDVVVPYGGGLTAAAAPDSFAYWGAVNGCSGDPAVTYTQGGSQCQTYESCSGGVRVSLCSVQGGHVLYSNSDNVPIAELGWAFLSQYALP